MLTAYQCLDLIHIKGDVTETELFPVTHPSRPCHRFDALQILNEPPKSTLKLIGLIINRPSWPVSSRYFRINSLCLFPWTLPCNPQLPRTLCNPCPRLQESAHERMSPPANDISVKRLQSDNDENASAIATPVYKTVW